jgi:hypothetical protein
VRVRSARLAVRRTLNACLGRFALSDTKTTVSVRLSLEKGEHPDKDWSSALGRRSDICCSYVQGLKRRIDHLEDLTRAKRPCSVVAAEASPDNRAHDQQSLSSRRISFHDALTDFGHFALNTAPVDTGASQKSATSSLSLWNLLRQTLEPAGRRAEDGPAVNSFARAPLRLSRETVIPTIQSYIKNIIPSHPFMEGQTLLRYAEYVVQSHRQAKDSRPSAANVHQFVLVYVALATVYSATRRSPDDLVLAAQLRSHAASMCTALNESETTLASQCVAALAICALHSNDLALSSRLSRLAMSNALAIGYHRLKPAPPSSMSREHRNDHFLFWTLYSLDRSASSNDGQFACSHLLGAFLLPPVNRMQYPMPTYALR